MIGQIQVCWWLVNFKFAILEQLILHKVYLNEMVEKHTLKGIQCTFMC